MGKVKNKKNEEVFRVRLAIPIALRSGKLRIVELAVNYDDSIMTTMRTLEEMKSEGAEMNFCIHLAQKTYFGVFEDTVVKSDGAVIRAGEVSQKKKRRVSAVSRELWNGNVLLATENGSIREVIVKDRGTRRSQLTVISNGQCVASRSSLRCREPTVIIATAITIFVGTRGGEIYCLNGKLELMRKFETDGGPIKSLKWDDSDDDFLFVGYDSGELRRINLLAPDVNETSSHDGGAVAMENTEIQESLEEVKMEIKEEEEEEKEEAVKEEENVSRKEEDIVESQEEVKMEIDENIEEEDQDSIIRFGPPLPSHAKKFMLPRYQQGGEWGLVMIALAENGSLYVTRDKKCNIIDNLSEAVDSSQKENSGNGAGRMKTLKEIQEEYNTRWYAERAARPWGNESMDEELDGTDWIRMKGQYRDMYVYDDYHSRSSLIAYGDNEALCCGGISSVSELARLTSSLRIIAGICWKYMFGVQLEGGILVIKFIGTGKVVVIDLKSRKGVEGSTAFNEKITTIAATTTGKAFEVLFYLGTDAGRIYKTVAIPSYINAFSIDEILQKTEQFERLMKSGDRSRVFGVEEIPLSSIGENRPVISITIEAKKEPPTFPPLAVVIYENGKAATLGKDGWDEEVDLLNCKISLITGVDNPKEEWITQRECTLYCWTVEGEEATSKRQFEIVEGELKGRIQGQMTIAGSTLIHIQNGKIRITKGVNC